MKADLISMLISSFLVIQNTNKAKQQSSHLASLYLSTALAFIPQLPLLRLMLLDQKSIASSLIVPLVLSYGQ